MAQRRTFESVYSVPIVREEEISKGRTIEMSTVLDRLAKEKEEQTEAFLCTSLSVGMSKSSTC